MGHAYIAALDTRATSFDGRDENPKMRTMKTNAGSQRKEAFRFNVDGKAAPPEGNLPDLIIPVQT